MRKRFFYFCDREEQSIPSKKLPYLYYDECTGPCLRITLSPQMPPDHSLCEIVDDSIEYRHALSFTRNAARRLNGSPFFVRQINLWSLDEDLIQKALADGLIKVTGSREEYGSDDCCLALTVTPEELAEKYGLQFNSRYRSFSK